MTLNTAIRGVQIEDVSISGAHLVATNSPSDGQVLTWNTTQDKFEWDNMGTMVNNETPTGDINGVNDTYTLDNQPLTDSETVHLNGLLQEPGVINDYTVNVSGSQITFVVAPETGDIVLVSYMTSQGLGADGADHGELGGLADDDHTQYILINGTRAFTGNIQANASGTLDIGSAAVPFKDLYLTGDSLYVAGSKAIGYTGGSVKFYGDGSSLTGVVSDHNDLGGLQGGDTNEYYHLNEHEEAQISATTDTLIYLGVATDTNIAVDQSADTITFEAANATRMTIGTGDITFDGSIDLSDDGYEYEIGGYRALAVMEGGSVAVGPALYSLIPGKSGGIQNVGIGDTTGNALTTGDGNVLIGSQAGWALSTTNDNVFIGASAGYHNEGASNVFLGRWAGYGESPGYASSNNTFVGYQSGYGITTGSDNVLVGYKSGDTLTTESNKLYIANDTGTPLIYGEFDNDIVQINGTLEFPAGTSINEFSTDGTMGGNSDDAVPTEKAVKTYVDASSGGISNVVEDVTPQLGGDLDLNEKYLELNSSPTSDDTGNGLMASGVVDTNASGVGAALYMASDGNYDTADASAVGTMPCTAIALETGTGTKKVLLTGYVRNDGWNWTAGGLMYVSTAVGELTQTAPAGSGDQVQVIGYAVSADVMFFSPNLTLVEIA